ncbi:MAG: GntR family transcriptional regulator [Proteobacteria bacterium]|nr:GntR family transcriptional regulator [Pseudomonadota bacterium]
MPDSKKETLVEFAYQWIREAILDGNIQPGAKLIERELTQTTGVSRSALREALVSLDEKGLVQREPYRGYRVTNLTKKQVQDLYELREVVESQAAELFALRATDSDLKDLSVAFRYLKDNIFHQDMAVVRRAKVNYYSVIYAGCKNVELERALSNLIERIFYLRGRSLLAQSRRKKSLAEFKALTDALIRRDRKGAREITHQHLKAAKEAILSTSFAAEPPD